ncbi:hypothetical protein ACO0LD_31710 [Undibacterium sp. Ji83W]|uniref:hypothetical protein n=1 Tax=Undibacterium sp. Ji83W TaxID=3413043 RepID=UPI003BF1279C
MEISNKDAELFRSLVLDADEEPTFDLLKYCLTWPDERPIGRLSTEGSEFLSDLWIVRGFIHRSLPKDQWGLDPLYFEEVWEFGLANFEQWPGFKRLVLSENDKTYLTSCLATPLFTI